MSDFERFKEEWPSKENVYSPLTDKKVSDKKYEHILKVWNKFGMKKMKDYQDFHLKCDVLLLTDEDKSLKICGFMEPLFERTSFKLVGWY